MNNEKEVLEGLINIILNYESKENRFKTLGDMKTFFKQYQTFFEQSKQYPRA